MITETYLEYLCLNSILDGYMCANELTLGRPDDCEFWYANNTKGRLHLHKLKDRVTKLQKELLENYVIDIDSKE